MTTEGDDPSAPLTVESPSTSPSSPTTTPQQSPPAAAPKSVSARARAQARRRRILQKGKDRMDYVNGVAETATTDGETDAPTPGETDAAPPTADDSDAGDAVTGATASAGDEDAPAAEEPSVPPALTGAQRLAQARRRRYKRPAVADVTPAVAEDGGDGTDGVVGDGTDGGVAVTSAVEEVVEETVEGGGGSEVEGPVTEKKKKYLGVARMRRKMLAERKANEDSENTAIAAKANKNRSKAVVNIPVLPIFFHLVTILALFFVGFDVGVQNHYMGTYQNLSSGPNVVPTLSLFDNGYGILSTLGLYHTQTTTTNILSDVTATTTIIQSETPILLDTEDIEDEFQTNTNKPLGATTTTHRPPNIDPIFDVDLDDLTLDKPGFLMFLCRIAIRFHRSITYFLYLLPKSILQGIWGYNPLSNGLPSLLSAIRRPIFCVTAIVLRNVGKYALGAADRVPELETVLEMRMEAEMGCGIQEITPTTGIEKAGKTLENLDVMGMGIDYAKKFLENNFPTAVVLYRFLQHVKSDMYVMMCGFFLGLVMPVGMMVGVGVQIGANKEEL